MKLFTAWVAAAGFALAAASAQAQEPAPPQTDSPASTKASDVDGPYAAVPPEVPSPPRPEIASPPRNARGPSLLPPTEVYTVLRENGFLPLGIPRQRGLVYTIAVMDRGGGDGRLVIDARNGRIVRFEPAYRMRDYFARGPMLPPFAARVPRPPAPVPHVASRTPVPKPSPLAAKPTPAAAPAQAAAPAPAQQAAVVGAKPAETQAAPQAAAPAVSQTAPPAPAAPAVLPTQEMPKVQGLE
ncbi:hypothetical protein [Bradyrhizobium lablabi]|uniref:hypothetical protein n=1 Tax=Bradyrhizobium lablabi TaxID=722472 RepID=UPI001BA9B20E|nr:hypothetical protein [Bradyrhizobium lablabi]MBR0696977.1 hypothetical protein [Bradyrhizobium lablabi]